MYIYSPETCSDYRYLILGKHCSIIASSFFVSPSCTLIFYFLTIQVQLIIAEILDQKVNVIIVWQNQSIKQTKKTLKTTINQSNNNKKQQHFIIFIIFIIFSPSFQRLETRLPLLNENPDNITHTHTQKLTLKCFSFKKKHLKFLNCSIKQL